MAQYRTGTVTVTNGSNTVTGVGTLWDSIGIQAGWLFNIVGEVGWYYVSQVNSNTELELTTTFGGTSGATQSYVIIRDYLPAYDIPLINVGDIHWTSLVNEQMIKISEQLETLATGTFSYSKGVNLLVTGVLNDGDENVASCLAPFGGTITKVRAEVDYAPVGADIIIDILVDEVSVFSSTKLEIPDGSYFSAENTLDTTMSQYSTISINIDQVGVSTRGGQDLRLIFYFEGGPDSEVTAVTTVDYDDSPFSVLVSHRFIAVDTTLGNVILELEDAALTSGIPYEIKKNCLDLNTITITGTIDGNSSVVLNRPWQSIRLKSNGTSYNILG